MRRHVLALLVPALLVAACGGGGSGGVPADADLVVEAVSNFGFEPAEATVQAGEVTIAMDNVDEQRHTLVIDEERFKIDAQGGGSDGGTVELEPGTYTFYCDVPGHRSAGMEGTLEVE